MKILICRITDDGVVLRSINLIKELIKLGHEIVVVAPKGKQAKTLVELGAQFIDIHIEGHGTNPLADLRLYSDYKKILREQKPDLALLYTTKPNIYSGIACRKYHVPVIMNITGMGSALGNKGAIQNLMVKLYKISCGGKNMKRLFFQNEDSMEFFRKNQISRSEIYKRIPGSGVDLQKYSYQEFPDSDSINFLFIARVMKQKGIDQYLEAAREVRKRHPETVFHVLGSCDEEYVDVMKREEKDENVIYHGEVDNVVDYVRMSQCTIQPSYYPEGVSNVILEAAACGRPVITTDHPGCREGVDDGVTGYIVPVQDGKAVIKAVEKILNMTREERIEMGRRGRVKMEREFDQQIVVKEYLREIEHYERA